MSTLWGTQYSLQKQKIQTGGVCSWKKSLSTLVKMDLSLFKGKRKAGVGGLEPDCLWEVLWGVHGEGLPRTTLSSTWKKSSTLATKFRGAVLQRETHQPPRWGSALGFCSGKYWVQLPDESIKKAQLKKQKSFPGFLSIHLVIQVPGLQVETSYWSFRQICIDLKSELCPAKWACNKLILCQVKPVQKHLAVVKMNWHLNKVNIIW